MIAEVILITELLKKTVGTPNSTSKAPSPTPAPITTGWEVLTQAGITDVKVNLDSADVAAYREQIAVKKALR